jgi:hypothetical protein
MVRKMYIWHEANFKNANDFPPANINRGDSLHRGLNWMLHKQTVQTLTASDFFTIAFITNYESIASYMENRLKDGSVKWGNGDLPPFPAMESDPWCNCQDFPNHWDWNRIILLDLHISNDAASFAWDFGGAKKYAMTARKEKGQWRIDTMAGFTLKNYLLHQ